ncbi:hypothetical protein GCM10022393_26830 [Aquimarina addita]|uniref:DUF1963 domain-containing protein n=1 Tax=Aquimarina addita TaxID=870485 RepID=A0ABP6UPK7_9FLAO
MTIKEIQNKIARPITKFTTGGFRPENTIEESWIGKVSVFKNDEEIPIDKNGDLMISLGQLYIPNLPFIHKNIQNTKVITVFISKELPKCLEKMGDRWLIREYKNLDEIKIKNLKNPTSFLKPFPLKSEFIKKDFPIWDGGGLSGEMEDEIIKLEREGIIRSYYDITDHTYEHKIGGYPSFCQPGIGDSDGFGEGFEFVFQISSDEKANLNVVDSGSLMFAKNKKTEEWSIYYDFY